MKLKEGHTKERTCSLDLIKNFILECVEDCEPTCGCWNSNMSSLEKQPKVLKDGAISSALYFVWFLLKDTVALTENEVGFGLKAVFHLSG